MAPYAERSRCDAGAHSRGPGAGCAILTSLIPGVLTSWRIEAMAMLVCSVEEGSLSEAARKLRIPVATLTRNVNDLEASVRTKLLVRSTRKLNLTEAGVEYVASAKQILEQVEEQERRAAGEF